MTGKDIVKLILEEKLEDYEFCVANSFNGQIKAKANMIVSWPNCEKFGKESYDTSRKGDAKIAILTEIIR